jgi:hypothetical protein
MTVGSWRLEVAGGGPGRWRRQRRGGGTRIEVANKGQVRSTSSQAWPAHGRGRSQCATLPASCCSTSRMYQNTMCTCTPYVNWSKKDHVLKKLTSQRKSWSHVVWFGSWSFQAPSRHFTPVPPPPPLVSSALCPGLSKDLRWMGRCFPQASQCNSGVGTCEVVAAPS